MSTLYSLLFLGGWLGVGCCLPVSLWLELKTVFICFIFVLVRATLPRYRYDQLMEICWQLFLPFNLIYLVTLMGLFLVSGEFN